MPRLWGKDAKKDELIRNLPVIYRKLQMEYNISAGDFPDLHVMQHKLRVSDEQQT